jgi:hypothetical protein
MQEQAGSVFSEQYLDVLHPEEKSIKVPVIVSMMIGIQGEFCKCFIIKELLN